MASYHERQKNLFNHLKDAEDQHSFSKTNKASPEQDYGTIDRHTYKKLKREMRQFRGRESIYKRQEANIKECVRAKTIPDFIKNPKKWVYYSLSDVTPDQMSDATNTATALAFIKEMENRESSMEMETEFDDTGVFKKPTFQASKTIKKIEPKPDEKAVFKGNKIIMPEYVVGMTKKKERKTRTTKKETEGSSDETKKVSLKLNHLFDEDEEE
ncbi:uncharacterized protein LOC126372559 [Pectinophora gossypiella]|uniref:U5 small nuclear ribonucleoprotein TSSC4 n=2 Tax=Pectinophora gossypiella TaxID=13191 RepID=A0A1E1WEH8_PECGO|nr:uncharacterized protein LOC126372559 [Pectinophora gossypiella]